MATLADKEIQKDIERSLRDILKLQSDYILRQNESLDISLKLETSMKRLGKSAYDKLKPMAAELGLLKEVQKLDVDRAKNLSKVQEQLIRNENELKKQNKLQEDLSKTLELQKKNDIDTERRKRLLAIVEKNNTGARKDLIAAENKNLDKLKDNYLGVRDAFGKAVADKSGNLQIGLLEKNKNSPAKYQKDVKSDFLKEQARLLKKISDLNSIEDRRSKVVAKLDKDSNKLLQNVEKIKARIAASQKASLDGELEARLKIDELEKSERGVSSLKAKESTINKIFGDTVKQFAETDLSKSIGFTKFFSGIGMGGRIALEAFYKIAEFGVRFFLKMDEEFFKLRKNFGFLRGENLEIESIGRDIVRHYTDMGVTLEGTITSISEIGKSFGLSSSMSKEIVANVALFSAQLGIAERTSSLFLKNISTISGKPVREASIGMMGFAKSMSNAAGVPLPDVMNDIATSSDSIRATFRGNTLELIKATVEARRMGLSLESSGRSAEGLLDFNQSVNSEMEASVLLGKNINLMEARRLAFVGDLNGMNKEILRVVRDIGEFDKLNMFQKKAIAQATGKSIEELQTMLQREKELEHVRYRGSDAAKKALADYERLTKLKETDAKLEGLAAEAKVKSMANQALLNTLGNQFSQIMVNLSGPIMDLTGDLLTVATKIFPILIGPAKIIGTIFEAIYDIAKRILVSIFEPLYNSLVDIGGMSSDIGEKFHEIYIKIKPVLMILSDIASVLLGVVFWPVIAGIVKTVNQFTGLFKIVSGFIEICNGDFYKGFKHLVEGIYDMTVKIFIDIGAFLIRKVTDIIYDTVALFWKIPDGIKEIKDDMIKFLLDPFKSCWKWLEDRFFGHSPSELGLSIVEGIKSIGGMLFDGLTNPFRTAWDFIGKIFNIQNLGTNIVNKFRIIVRSLSDIISSPFKLAYEFIQDMFNKIPDLIKSVFLKGLNLAMVIPSMAPLLYLLSKVSSDDKKTIQPETTTVSKSEQVPVAENTNKAIVDKLDELIKLMKSGGIAVQLDGHKVSQAIANSTF